MMPENNNVIQAGVPDIDSFRISMLSKMSRSTETPEYLNMNYDNG